MLSLIGLVLIGIGVYLLIARKKSLDKILEIKSTVTSTTGELHELQKAVAGEIGPGGFNHPAEVKGTVECETPLTAELSEQLCIWYQMKVEERYEETYQERDSEGHMHTRTRTGTTTVASNTQSVPFALRDGAGSIVVDPEGATIDGRKTVDRHEPWTGNKNKLNQGRFRFSGHASRGKRILGYHYSEQLVPLGAQVYVIGEATDGSGKPVIGNPADKEKPFILSMRSEAEVTQGLESTASIKKWAGFGLIAGGILLAIFGLMG